VRQRVAEVRPELVDRREQGLPVHYLTFTVPPALRARYTDRKEWLALAREAFRILRRHGMACAVEATHPVGDKAAEAVELDGDACTFHPHLNFLAVQRKGWRYKLDVHELREQWAEALGIDSPSSLPFPHVEIHWPQSARDRDKAAWAHVTRYVLRPFAGWQAWLPSVRWFGAYPKGVDYTCKCPTCRRTFDIVAAGDQARAIYYARATELGLDLVEYGLADHRPVVLAPLDPPPPPSRSVMK
jgi:hypothetical protein